MSVLPYVLHTEAAKSRQVKMSFERVLGRKGATAVRMCFAHVRNRSCQAKAMSLNMYSGRLGPGRATYVDVSEVLQANLAYWTLGGVMFDG